LHILIFKFVERRLEVLAVMNGKVNSNTETNQMDRGEAHLWYLGRRRCGWRSLPRGSIFGNLLVSIALLHAMVRLH